MASLTIGGLQYCAETSTYRSYFDVTDSLETLGEFIGDDIPIPGMAGQLDGDRVFDHMTITIEGWIEGKGADIGTRRTNYRARADALRAKLDASLGVQNIVRTMENASTKTVSAKFSTMESHGLVAGFFQRFTYTFVCVNSTRWS